MTTSNVTQLRPDLDEPMHPDPIRNAEAWVRFLVDISRHGDEENRIAGLDAYDEAVLIVRCPDKLFRDQAEIMLDVLRLPILTDDGTCVRAEVSVWMRRRLGLDGADAPRIVTALASRGVR